MRCVCLKWNFYIIINFYAIQTPSDRNRSLCPCPWLKQRVKEIGLINSDEILFPAFWAHTRVYVCVMCVCESIFDWPAWTRFAARCTTKPRTKNDFHFSHLLCTRISLIARAVIELFRREMLFTAAKHFSFYKISIFIIIIIIKRSSSHSFWWDIFSLTGWAAY